MTHTLLLVINLPTNSYVLPLLGYESAEAAVSAGRALMAQGVDWACGFTVLPGPSVEHPTFSLSTEE